MQRRRQYQKSRYPGARDVYRCSVCETHDPTGEPSAGKLHARFGERGEETWQWGRLRHRHMAKAAGNGYSLPLTSARPSSTLPPPCPTMWDHLMGLSARSG